MNLSERNRRRLWQSARTTGIVASLVVLIYLLRRISDAPTSTEVERWVAIAQVLTLAALGWYALETRMMRIDNSQQVRLTIMPIVRVVLAKAPDKVFLENIGAGIASKAWLQGFRYKDGNDTLRCSFDSVHKILPGKEVAPYIDIVVEQAPLGRLGPAHTAPAGGNMVFRAIGHAVKRDRPLVLKLYVVDVLGHCYVSDVRIYWEDFALFVSMPGPPTDAGQPKTENPILIKDLPEQFVLVDAT
jgi:hypothetical protein